MISELTPQENAQYEMLVSLARQEAAPTAETARATYIRNRVDQLVKGGLAPEKAKLIVQARLADGALHPDDKIVFQRFSEVTVAEILADPTRYHRQACADPLEPEEGLSKAMVYVNRDDSITLYSHLHGGKNFILRPAPAKNAKEPEEGQCQAADILGNIETPDFPVELMPEVIGEYARDQAELMGVDPGIICMTGLAAVAGCLDDRIKLQPKRHDPTWRESARLWVAIIGDPSTMKSPGISKGLSPVRRIAQKYRDAHEKAMKEWAAECDDLKAVDKKAKLPPAPDPKRLTVSDATVEKLGEILSKQDRGILAVRDELSGWLTSMDAYKNGTGADRAAWLEAYNGGPHEVDRIGRGTIFIKNWGTSVVGGIQPSVVDNYAKVTNHDGMLQRFIPYRAKDATPGVDRAPNMQAKERYTEMLEHVVEIQPCLEVVELSEEAHRIREAFDKKLIGAMQSFPNKHLIAALGKWRGTFARLLLVFHVAETWRTDYPTRVKVSEETARKVAQLLWRFLLPQAIAFYEGMDQTHNHARQLAALILARGWDRFTVKRDLHNHMAAYRGMSDRERDDMLDALEAYGWIKGDASRLSERGKPTAYKVNPDVHIRYSEQAETERKRRATVVEIMRDLQL